MGTRLLPRNKQDAEKVLEEIAKNGKRIKQSTMYILNGDKYVLTGNQAKWVEELKNGRHS